VQRGHFWRATPSGWLVPALLWDIAVVSVLAMHGFLLAAIPLRLMTELLVVLIAYLRLMDFMKLRLFSRLGLRLWH